jgi:F-type H+-transporting ATPase subunit epsilon
VDMVVLPGVEGELGILPMHVPLMTRLLPGEVRILRDGKQTELVVGTGFVEVSQTHVSILTDMAMADTEIDEAAAEEAVKRAEARAREKDLNAEEVAEIQSSIARSLAQLKFKRRRHTH